MPLARRPTKSASGQEDDDDSILRSHSFSSVSLLHSRVTATAAIPAVPAISTLREIRQLVETSDDHAIPDLSTVAVASFPGINPEKCESTSGLKTSKSRNPKILDSGGRSIFDYPGTSLYNILLFVAHVMQKDMLLSTIRLVQNLLPESTCDFNRSHALPPQ